MSTMKRALMNPIPTFAVALKWVSSMTSIVSTPGPHGPTWFGSMTNAQTRSRGAVMSTVPLNFMRASMECVAGCREERPPAPSMKRVRQPIEQNA